MNSATGRARASPLHHNGMAPRGASGPNLTSETRRVWAMTAALASEPPVVPASPSITSNAGRAECGTLSSALTERPSVTAATIRSISVCAFGIDQIGAKARPLGRDQKAFRARCAQVGGLSPKLFGEEGHDGDGGA